MAITTISTKSTEQEAREEMEKHNGSNLRRCMGYGETAERFWLYDYAYGLVLDIYEHNGYDDSDFYALVWNEKEQKIDHVEYATTRGWSYPCNAWIDATPEVIEKARESRRDAIRATVYGNAEKKAKEIQEIRKYLADFLTLTEALDAPYVPEDVKDSIRTVMACHKFNTK